MNKEDKIKRNLGVAVKILEDVAEKLGDLQKEHEKAQPDLPDNTLPNAPVRINGVIQRYLSSIDKVFDSGRTAVTGSDKTTEHHGKAVIDRNHGPDNHWLPWDGKDELPPYVKPDDWMTVKYINDSDAMIKHGKYVSTYAFAIKWRDVIQYLWLERDSDE